MKKSEEKHRETEKERKKLHVLCRWNCCVVVRASRAYILKSQKVNFNHTYTKYTNTSAFFYLYNRDSDDDDGRNRVSTNNKQRQRISRSKKRAT